MDPFIFLFAMGFIIGFIVGLSIFKKYGCAGSVFLSLFVGIFSSFLFGLYIFPILIGGVINPLIKLFGFYGNNIDYVYKALFTIFLLIALPILAKKLIDKIK